MRSGLSLQAILGHLTPLEGRGLAKFSYYFPFINLIRSITFIRSDSRKPGIFRRKRKPLSLPLQGGASGGRGIRTDFTSRPDASKTISGITGQNDGRADCS